MFVENDYYINGAGKWCSKKFAQQQKLKIDAPGTSDKSDTNEAIGGRYWN